MNTSIRLLFLAVCLILGINEMRAQDIILKKDNTMVVAIVDELTPTDIVYRDYRDQNGPQYRIPKEQVVKIQYKNGYEEVFNIRQYNNAAGHTPGALQPQTPSGQQGGNSALSSVSPYFSQGKLSYEGKGDFFVGNTQLTDQQLRTLVGEDVFENTVRPANRKRLTGKTFKIIGYSAAAIGIPYVLVGLLEAMDYYDGDIVSHDNPLVTIGTVLTIAGATCLCIGIPLSSSAKRSLTAVSNDYNASKGYISSLNIGLSNYGVSLALKF